MEENKVVAVAVEELVLLVAARAGTKVELSAQAAFAFVLDAAKKFPTSGA